MLGFNTEFQNGTSKITQVRLSVLLESGTLLSLDETNVMLNGFSRDSATSIDGEFTIGAAVTGKMTAVIDNSTNDFSGYDFRGATITARLGGQLSDGTYQLLQVGIYTVDGYSYDGSNISLTAYDNMQMFDVACSDATVSFPATLSSLVNDACDLCGVTLANSSLPNGSLSIPSKPLQWDTMTWHDVISSYAQMAGCFAKILPNGRLYFTWYDTANLQGVSYDGGSFSTTPTPYSDGDDADGGDFTYSEATSYDGGHFGDRDNTHIINQMYDITVDTDDVYITGVKVLLSATDNVEAVEGTTDYSVTLGTTDYMITIEHNPLIETPALASTVCTYLYDYLVGMRFRPLNASVLENPSIEAGDVAIVTDRDNNTYACFISHATYISGAATYISCDAASPLMNLRSRYTERQKTKALAHRVFDQAMSDAEEAMSTIMSALATTMGLYQYTEDDGDGGTIYIYGNASTLAASNIRWKFSAGAVMVSSDYGATWNGAISSDGIAVLQEIYAVKVNADNILTGTLTIGGSSGNRNGYFYLKDSSNNVLVSMSKNGAYFKGAIQSGSTITGATISGNTISGNTISGGTISATTLSGSTVSGNTISGGTITGATLSSNTISSNTISGNTISSNTISSNTISGGTITGTAITVGGSGTAGSITVKDSSNNTLVSMTKNGVSIKGTLSTGSTIAGSITSTGTITGGTIKGTTVSGGTIDGGTISGTSISVGGENNGNGSITVYDNNDVMCSMIDNNGYETIGKILSYYTNQKFATLLNGGRLFFFYGDYTIDNLRKLKWSDSCGGISPMTRTNTTLLGVTMMTHKDFIAFGAQTESTSVTPYLIVNVSQSYDAITERIYVKNASVRLNSGNINITSGSINAYSGDISIYNDAPQTTHKFKFWNAARDAYVGIYLDEHNGRLYMYRSSTAVAGAGLYVSGSLTVTGTKNRAVETEHYGTVGMNAFETASSHFADVGSGTIGEDGTVTIFFDPVFAETIDMKAEYQVLITRTSEKQTEWVDKQNGYFIAHGESGATFDWMIIGYQRDYVTNRLENIGKAAEAVNDDPIYKEDTSAIDAVEEMVSQYNSELEDLENG